MYTYVVAVLHSNFRNAELIGQLHAWDRNFSHVLFKQSIAMTMSDQGQYKNADKIYTKIGQLNPDFLEAKINHAIILYDELKGAKRALKIFQQVAKHPNFANLNPNMHAMIDMHRAAAYLHDNQLGQAEEFFIQAANTNRDTSEVITFASKTYKSAKKFKPLTKLISRMARETKPSGAPLCRTG